MDPHPRSPALMRVRAAVRAVLTRVRDEATREATGATEPLVLVGLGEAFANAAATALEAPRTGSRAGAVIVDHGLQAGSSAVADRAAAHARDFGLSPVVLRRARIEQDRGSSAGGDARVAAGGAAGGPEAVARAARYAEFVRSAYHQSDIDTVRVIRMLAESGGLAQ